VLGAGEAEILPQDFEEALVHWGEELVTFAVDGEAEAHLHAGSAAAADFSGT
jgi:hypothetical protein